MNKRFLMPTYKDAYKLAEEFFTTDMYDEVLDDIYGDVEIAGLSYSTSWALKKVDLIAYDTGFNDFVDSEATRLEDKYYCPICEDEFQFEDDAVWCCQNPNNFQYNGERDRYVEYYPPEAIYYLDEVQEDNSNEN